MAEDVERGGVDSTTVDERRCTAGGPASADNALPCDEKQSMRLHLRLEVRRTERGCSRRALRKVGGLETRSLTLALCPLPVSTW